ncbi:MAG TPA: TlpA disulfide reductase family protein [Stellaceae bacterium]|jgi:thiol-disulfide isomerase/thioredoxin|nr:TlpA disulfide reductase family protein [Stellaceae bacterium]
MRTGCIALLAVLTLFAGAAQIARAEPGGGEPAPLGQFIPASPPHPAPRIAFADAAGKTVSLDDFKGKLVIVNLWATWCAPCRKEMPSLEQLQTRLGGKITILAISEDMGGGKAVAPFIAKLGLKAVKIYLDPKNAAAQAFKVDGLPTSFLIDPRGRVLGRVEGEADWDSPKMLAVIEPLLPQDDIVKTSFPQARP